jgi:protein-S-isoprenylcysteine O-methyltransferase Ste14
VDRLAGRWTRIKIEVGDPKGKVLPDGIYQVVRDPRYLSGGVGVVATIRLLAKGQLLGLKWPDDAP